MKEKNWFPFPRHDGLFIIGLVLYTIIFFSPWTYDVMILNITLLAWGAYLLCILAPVTGILLALRGHDTNLKTKKTEEKSNYANY